MRDISQTSNFRLEDFFKGDFHSYGKILNRKGNTIRNFSVTGNAIFRKETLILDEKLIYDDGAQEDRVWQILTLPSGRYEGHTHGLVGKAPIGCVQDNIFRWNYRLKIPIRNIQMTFCFRDEMTLSDHYISNSGKISLFGFDILSIEQKFFQGKISAQAI